jgi:hypothetical protein
MPNVVEAVKVEDLRQLLQGPMLGFWQYFRQNVLNKLAFLKNTNF